jgi:thioredoxin 1|tara:strand:- start:9 stop:332 length:324 start_codon:yes stop_codon:yes gene_type:complete
MSADIKNLDESTFDETIGSSETPVLVDFWAEWCGPCKMIAPILEEIAIEEKGLTIAKVNVDDSPDLARRYGIMSIPALILFQNGEPAKTMVGAKPKSALLEELGEFL